MCTVLGDSGHLNHSQRAAGPLERQVPATAVEQRPSGDRERDADAGPFLNPCATSAMEISMPYGNPGGYGRKRGTQRRAARGNGGLVAALQQVLARYAPNSGGAGGGRRGAAGRLGKGMTAAARSRSQRVGDNIGFGFDDDGEGNYGDTGRGGVRIGYRK